MKKHIITLLLFIFFIPGFSQNSKYEYDGRFTPFIKKEKLNDVLFINEIMPEFSRYFSLGYKERVCFDQLLKLVESPEGMSVVPQENYFSSQENYNKIIDLLSIEIIGICNGKTLSAQSSRDPLTIAQKNILKAADFGTDIRIKIKFKFKYWAEDRCTSNNKIKEGEYLVTVVPETEAEYPGGYKQLSKYLTANVTNKISNKIASEKLLQAGVKFIINEEGQIVNAKIYSTSADPKIDKLILDAINKMPKWKPAKNSKGIKVKQEFNIPFGGGGC